MFVYCLQAQAWERVCRGTGLVRFIIQATGSITGWGAELACAFILREGWEWESEGEEMEFPIGYALL